MTEANTEFNLKVECLPGIKLTPQMLVAQILGDVESLRGVVIVTFEKDTDPETPGYAEICFAGVKAPDVALATMLLQHEMMRRIDEQNDD